MRKSEAWRRWMTIVAIVGIMLVAGALCGVLE
jgi:hypothetical protein